MEINRLRIPFFHTRRNKATIDGHDKRRISSLQQINSFFFHLSLKKRSCGREKDVDEGRTIKGQIGRKIVFLMPTLGFVCVRVKN
jgi:hypothetical protein